MLTRWLYRSRQFFTALLGRVSKEEMREARRVLGPQLYSVFAAMPGQYRRHALSVYRRVREAGCDDPNVWQAALLHDSGKYDPATGRYVTIIHRVAIVLLKSVSSGRVLLEKLAEPLDANEMRGLAGYWRYPFYLSKHHAARGAQIAAQHGANEQVVALIARHHDYSSPGRAAATLQAADEAG